MAIKINVEITPIFINMMEVTFPEKIRDGVKSAMHDGMKEIEKNAKREWAAEQTWLPEGEYKHGNFEWYTSGISINSMTGYEVHDTNPFQYNARTTDRFNRVHRTDPSVAPIPAKEGDKAIGVLTMYASSDPPSGDSETLPIRGRKRGLQAYEIEGSPDGHIQGRGQPLTIRALEKYQSELESILRKRLEMELKL